MNFAAEKARLRSELRFRRLALAAAIPDHAGRLAAHADMLALPPRVAVAGYCALPGEADPAPLLAALRERGHAIALPRVVGKGEPLVFHAYAKGDRLTAGAYGVQEPHLQAPLLDAPIVLVPLLAFDAAGRRLGYGGGYYDRTLAGLRAAGPIVAIGIAFAGQEVEQVPDDAFDQRLDAVLTERGLRNFTADAPSGQGR